MKTARKVVLSFICVLLLACSAFILSSCGENDVKLFNLSFKVDGENYQTTETSGSEQISIPKNPEKEGYTFDGWYWDENEWSRPFTANSLLNAPISSDMAVYAKFTAIEYSINYVTAGASHSNPDIYTVEDSFVLSKAEKLGYAFEGWYSDEEYTNRVEAVSKGAVGDRTFYAKFEIVEYTVSYENTKDSENINLKLIR